MNIYYTFVTNANVIIYHWLRISYHGTTSNYYPDITKRVDYQLVAMERVTVQKYRDNNKQLYRGKKPKNLI